MRLLPITQSQLPNRAGTTFFKVQQIERRYLYKIVKPKHMANAQGYATKLLFLGTSPAWDMPIN